MLHPENKYKNKFRVKTTPSIHLTFKIFLADILFLCLTPTRIFADDKMIREKTNYQKNTSTRMITSKYKAKL